MNREQKGKGYTNVDVEEWAQEVKRYKIKTRKSEKVGKSSKKLIAYN